MGDIQLIYVGHFVNEDMLGTFLGPAVSGNRMHMGLLNELDKVTTLDAISVMPIATYPQENQVRIRACEKRLKSGVAYKQIKFTNLFIWKHVTQICSLYKTLKKTSATSENSVILNFNPYMELSIPTLLFSKLHRIKTVCIVADIPVTIPKNYSFVKKILRKIEIKLYYSFLKHYDGLVVLNKNVIETFSIKKPFYLMDGGVSTEEIDCSCVFPTEQHELNKILYTGALEQYNGIEQLIEAFSMVKNPELRLVICGDGSLRDVVVRASRDDGRIIYKGNISNQETKQLQQKAGLLISTRPVDLFAMKLTFPSKIIEYMLSGTPVLSTHLNGLSQEYEQCMFFTGQSSREIAESIERVYSLNIDERFERADMAYKYVVKCKNYAYHCNEMVNLLEEVLRR